MRKPRPRNVQLLAGFHQRLGTETGCKNRLAGSRGIFLIITPVAILRQAVPLAQELRAFQTAECFVVDLFGVFVKLGLIREATRYKDADAMAAPSY